MEENELKVINVVSSAPKHKIVFLGDSFVGKTCLISKFVCGTFDQTYNASLNASLTLG